MLRGLGKLTWLELKIFVREPLGVFGIGGDSGAAVRGPRPDDRSRGNGPPGRRGSARRHRRADLRRVILIALNAVLSLVTIIAIYREGGILKRLRATPLRPHVILTAHVIVKLIMTAVTLAAAYLVGVRYALHPCRRADGRLRRGAAVRAPWPSCRMGFLIASLVPTARFAQPVGSLLLYPMIARVGPVRAAGVTAAGVAAARARPAALATPCRC